MRAFCIDFSDIALRSSDPTYPISNPVTGVPESGVPFVAFHSAGMNPPFPFWNHINFVVWLYRMEGERENTLSGLMPSY